jgi:xylulokinase
VTGLVVERPGNATPPSGRRWWRVGVGFYADPRAAVAQCVSVLDRCDPDPARHALYSEFFAIYKQAQAALAPLNHHLHAILEKAPKHP